MQTDSDTWDKTVLKAGCMLFFPGGEESMLPAGKLDVGANFRERLWVFCGCFSGCTFGGTSSQLA